MSGMNFYSKLSFTWFVSVKKAFYYPITLTVKADNTMLQVFQWFSKELAIDLGTANSLVYVPRKGIVLNEPSVVAFDSRNNKIIAIGQQAKDMLGKAPEHIKVIRPLKDGVIADFKFATMMLKHFIKESMRRNHFLRPRVVIAVPSGITEVEKKAVIDSAMQVGAVKVTIILEPIAAAIGVGLPIQEPSGSMVVDIGGGTTDVAVISLSGIIARTSLRIAGDEMDEAILRYIRQKYNLLIGLKTAESIKKIMGSALPLYAEGFVEIRGLDVTQGIPAIKRISSEEIRDALAEPVFAIVNAVRQTLELTPPEALADIIEHGIVLTGGGSLLKNLDCKIKEEVGLPVGLADEPLLSVAIGTGKAMTEPKFLRQIAVE